MSPVAEVRSFQTSHARLSPKKETLSCFGVLQIMSPTYLSEYGRTLIDAMFHEQDQKLLKAFHDRMEKLDRRQQLAGVCGVDDEALLNHLIDLELQPEVVAALAVVPLVAVAWADNAIQPQERDAIMQAAEASGVTSQDGRYPILEHWLSNKPGREILDAWKLYIAALCKQLDDTEIEELKHDLLDRAQKIAEAAGGILGITRKISSRERQMLETLKQAFSR